MLKLLNILQVNTIIAAKYILTFNLLPKYTKNIETIAFKKNPTKNSGILNFFCILRDIPLNNESKNAITATATYSVKAKGTTTSEPITYPSIAKSIIIKMIYGKRSG